MQALKSHWTLPFKLAIYVAVCVIVYCYTKVGMLDSVAKTHPTSYWWVKGDGCDLNQGLCESVQGLCSGDVDLNDGSLEKEFYTYKQHLSDIGEIGMKGSNEQLKSDLLKEQSCLSTEITFITRGSPTHKSCT